MSADTDPAPGRGPAGTDSRRAPEEDRNRLRDAGRGMRRPREIGGRDGPDPTRYGDWEKNGRCIDF